MHTEFRRVNALKEIRSLVLFDSKVFAAADRFPAEYWRQLESYWMLVGGAKIGCCGFERDVDFAEDKSPGGVNRSLPGSLYIASTAILPRYQGEGFGRLMKAWQVAFAWREEFRRIVTNTRKRNTAMIALNRMFGFEVIRTMPDYYQEPADATVVMELVRPSRWSRADRS